jgi:hypothetical protein
VRLSELGMLYEHSHADHLATALRLLMNISGTLVFYSLPLQSGQILIAMVPPQGRNELLAAPD